MSAIASSIPGRLRLRDASLREAARLEKLRATAAGWRGVNSVEANPRVGSLLLHYDAAVLTQGKLETRLMNALGLPAANAPQAGAVAMPAAPAAPEKRRVTRVAVNRQAKRVMLASLAASLALAVAGAKRWHAATGGLFLAALLVHLAVHRRHLWR